MSAVTRVSTPSRPSGAARVVGIDAQRFVIQQALFVGQVPGRGIEVRRMSVDDLKPHTMGRFEITLVLELTYHCKHLVRADVGLGGPSPTQMGLQALLDQRFLAMATGSASAWAGYW